MKKLLKKIEKEIENADQHKEDKYYLGVGMGLAIARDMIIENEI